MNRRRLFLWMLPGLTFTAVVFAGGGAPAPTLVPPPESHGQVSELRGERPIVRIVGRDHTILATSTPFGPRYSSTRADGEIVADHLTLDELRTRHPALYRELHPSVAGSHDPIGPIGTVDLAD